MKKILHIVFKYLPYIHIRIVCTWVSFCRWHLYLESFKVIFFVKQLWNSIMKSTIKNVNWIKMLFFWFIHLTLIVSRKKSQLKAAMKRKLRLIFTSIMWHTSEYSVSGRGTQKCKLVDKKIKQMDESFTIRSRTCINKIDAHFNTN